MDQSGDQRSAHAARHDVLGIVAETKIKVERGMRAGPDSLGAVPFVTRRAYGQS